MGFSSLAQRDEKLALLLLADQQRILRVHFRHFDGREVTVTGDGFVVEFPSALVALECAIEIQTNLHESLRNQVAEHRFQVRNGIYIGNFVHRDANMYGDGVNIASGTDESPRRPALMVQVVESPNLPRPKEP